MTVGAGMRSTMHNCACRSRIRAAGHLGPRVGRRS